MCISCCITNLLKQYTLTIAVRGKLELTAYSKWRFLAFPTTISHKSAFAKCEVLLHEALAKQKYWLFSKLELRWLTSGLPPNVDSFVSNIYCLSLSRFIPVWASLINLLAHTFLQVGYIKMRCSSLRSFVVQNFEERVCKKSNWSHLCLAKKKHNIPKELCCKPFKFNICKVCRFYSDVLRFVMFFHVTQAWSITFLIIMFCKVQNYGTSQDTTSCFYLNPLALSAVMAID